MPAAALAMISAAVTLDGSVRPSGWAHRMSHTSTKDERVHVDDVIIMFMVMVMVMFSALVLG
tara:strand:+ start:44 stop:229 length:186 start_codon:yes stop_codon:yes gene_type:complete